MAAPGDSQLQHSVQRELAWDRHVPEAAISVRVEAGVVTLEGTVGSLAERVAAQDAAQRVDGVLDVANEIRVSSRNRAGRSDTEIARAVRGALEWNALIDDERIRSKVAHGWVLLQGSVSSCDERDEVESVVRSLVGVCGVNNELEVEAPAVSERELKQAIEAALARRSDRQARRVALDVQDGVVVLSGTVDSVRERSAVLGAAKGTRGVRSVVDRLEVTPLHG